MEPVTHFLTGACIGRAGLNRLTAYATLAATLAAEAPDLDVVTAFAGPVPGFEYHRGITHTLIAAPVVATAVTGVIWIIDRAIRSRFKPTAGSQPIRWSWLWITALIADLSHLLLDWTNNYGLRPFFPFNSRWYAGDLVFIAEPVLWLLLLSALIFPALFGLADREVGVRPAQFRGRAWAVAALSGMVLLWCWRWAEHAAARNLVEAAEVTLSPATRIALEPYPISPWRWHAILETESSWQTAEVDTRTGIVQSDPLINSLLKPPTTSATEAARHTPLAQVYLAWSTWPVVRDLGPSDIPGRPPFAPPPYRSWALVEIADLRFAYNYRDLNIAGSPNQSLDPLLNRSPLNGWIYILDGKEVAQEFLEGREQK